MKTRKIKIGFKHIRAALDNFVETGETVISGESVKEEIGVYFTNVEAFSKAINPRRLELLNIIKAAKPSSINELALLAYRNIKNVAEDLKFLTQAGLIKIKEVQNRAEPQVDYDEIDVRIAI